jgi:hypothetical protein
VFCVEGGGGQNGRKIKMFAQISNIYADMTAIAQRRVGGRWVSCTSVQGAIYCKNGFPWDSKDMGQCLASSVAAPSAAHWRHIA